MMRPRRRIRLLGGIAALLLAAHVGCSSTGGTRSQEAGPATTDASAAADDDQRACDALGAQVRLHTPELPDPTNVLGREVVLRLLVARPSNLHVVAIYLDPGSSADALAEVAAEVADRSGVRAIRITDAAAAERDFRQLFAGDDEMLESVGADDLPASVTAAIAADQAQDLVRWADDRPDTFQTRDVGYEDGHGQAGIWVDDEGDRAALRRFDRQLRGMPGRPDWATYARIVNDALQHGGLDWIAIDMARMDDAIVSLIIQLDRCDRLSG